MDVRVPGTAGDLVAWHAAADGRRRRDSVLIVPGFPTDVGGGANSFATYPDLADRIAAETHMDALALAPRGVAGSQGHFSLGGWRRDVHSGIAHLRSLPQIADIWLLGFGTGAALAVDAAAKDGDIAGVVSVAAPADFTDWASRPRELLSHARTTGAIDDPEFPPDFGRWVRELEQTSAVRAAEALDESTRMLVIHGSADDAVPPLDARLIADAHGSAELRILEGARHHLRHDPRAMAIAVGWLARRGVAPTPLSRA